MQKIVFECKVKRKEKEALTKIFNWCIEQLYSVNRFDKGANNIAKINALEDEKVFKYTNSRGENFGMFCVSHLKECPELVPVVEKYILNLETATMQDASGYNIGMECARLKQQELFELAYKNPVARLQRNNKGETMALIANNNGILVPPLTEQELYEEYSNIYEVQIEKLCK